MEREKMEECDKGIEIEREIATTRKRKPKEKGKQRDRETK